MTTILIVIPAINCDPESFACASLASAAARIYRVGNTGISTVWATRYTLHVANPHRDRSVQA